MFSSLFSSSRNQSNQEKAENALMASMEQYFGKPEVMALVEEERLRRKAALRQKKPDTAELVEQAFRRQLKPLFKELLEIRYDFDEARGPYRKLMNSESGKDLKDRATKLKGYLENLENGTKLRESGGEPHYLKQFTAWLKKQVDFFVVALEKAMGTETVAKVAQTKSSSSPVSPQLSPFSPPISSSRSPNSNSNP